MDRLDLLVVLLNRIDQLNEGELEQVQTRLDIRKRLLDDEQKEGGENDRG